MCGALLVVASVADLKMTFVHLIDTVDTFCMLVLNVRMLPMMHCKIILGISIIP